MPRYWFRVCSSCAWCGYITQRQHDSIDPITCPQCRHSEYADSRRTPEYRHEDHWLTKRDYYDSERVRQLRLSEAKRRRTDASTLLRAPVNVAPRSRAV